MAQKSLRRPAHWMVAVSCWRTSLPGLAYASTPHGFYLSEFPSPYGSCLREARVWRQSRVGAPLHIFPRGYLLKPFPQGDTSSIPWCVAKDYRFSPARLPVLPLATRSQRVVFAYDQVIRPYRTYYPSGGLPRGKPQSRHSSIVRCQRCSQRRLRGLIFMYILKHAFK